MTTMMQRMRNLFKPRPKTDMQSEILNVVAGPIYVYTITCVYYYSLFDVMPYHYGDMNIHGTADDTADSNWVLFLHRCILTMIYFQMMSNWMCIRYTDNSLKTSVTLSNLSKTPEVRQNEMELSTVIVKSRNDEQTKSNWTSQNGAVIPGPTAAPPPLVTPTRSYWSWKMCSQCNLNAPPRCHHCPMCKTCVLKRDHHCFFTAKCIGFFNQRHFIVFLAWASFGTTYSTLHFITYLFRAVIPEMTSKLDIIPPLAFVRWMFGYSDFAIVNLLTSFLFNALFVFLSTGFLIDQYGYINKGVTQFECKHLDKNKLNIVDPRNFPDKVRAVFGYNYGLFFIFPLSHFIIQPHENPFEWPEHKIYRNKMKTSRNSNR